MLSELQKLKLINFFSMHDANNEGKRIDCICELNQFKKMKVSPKCLPFTFP